MDYYGLIDNLRNIIPTIVLDSLANLYKYKIIPSCEDVNTLREDILDLSICMSELEEVINYNATLLQEQLDNMDLIDTINNHAEIIEQQAEELANLKAKLKKIKKRG